MFSKCEKCGKIIKGGEYLCATCQKIESKDFVGNLEVDNFDRPCSLCGKRGRAIKTDTGRSRNGKTIYDELIRCYECNDSYVAKKYHSVSDKWLLKCSDFERQYHFAYRDDVLKPLFYGEAPSYARIEKLWGKILEQMVDNKKLQDNPSLIGNTTPSEGHSGSVEDDFLSYP